jgi:hypothetical protein
VRLKKIKEFNNSRVRRLWADHIGGKFRYFPDMKVRRIWYPVKGEQSVVID